MLQVTSIINDQGCRRSTRRNKKSVCLGNKQYTLQNHLKSENFLPTPLKQKIENMQFLSQKTITMIDRQLFCVQKQDFKHSINQMKLAVLDQQQKILKFNQFNSECYAENFEKSNKQIVGLYYSKLLNSSNISIIHKQQSLTHQPKQQMDIQPSNLDMFNDNFLYDQQIFEEGKKFLHEQDQLFF